MAVVQDNNQDNSDNSLNGNQQNPSSPISVSGSSAPSSAPSGASRSSTAAPGIQGAPSTSGRFQNIQNYLNANSDYNKQGGGLAGQVSQDLSKQADNYTNNINNAQKDWSDKYSSLNVNPNDAYSYVNNAVVNPTEITQDPNAVSKFQGYENASANYVAPSTFDSNQQYQAQVNNYKNTANLAGSESGRYALLNNLYGNPSYNQGQQKLDNLFLQSDPNGLNQLNQAQQYASNLQNTYNNTANSINGTPTGTDGTLQGGLIQQYATNAKNIQDNTRTILGGAITDFGSAANRAVTDATNGRNDAYTKEQDLLRAGKLSQSDIDNLASSGVVPGLNLYNVDPSSFLKQNTDTPTQQNIITPEQQQQIAAYSKLAGNSLSGDPTQVLNTFSGNQSAGSFDKNPYTFDSKGFLNATSTAGTNLVSGLKGIISGNDFLQNNPSVQLDPSSLLQYLKSDISQRQGDAPDGSTNQQVINKDNQSLQQLQGLFGQYGLDANGTSKLLSPANVLTGPKFHTLKNSLK